MAGEWTDWLAHDGGPCPLPVGTMCERKFDAYTVDVTRPQLGPRRYFEGPIREGELEDWLFFKGGPNIIAYRWKRPPGLMQLRKLAEQPRETVGA